MALIHVAAAEFARPETAIHVAAAEIARLNFARIFPFWLLFRQFATYGFFFARQFWA
jgi:hypothetical protein